MECGHVGGIIWSKESMATKEVGGKTDGSWWLAVGWRVHVMVLSVGVVVSK